MLKTSKYIYKNVCPSIKMENLLIAKNRNVPGYKSMPKDKLLGIIINNNNKNNKGDRKSIFKSKKEENKFL